MATSYNASPTPTTGQGAYGLVPGQTAIPPSIWQQMQDVPGFTGMTSSATGDISSQLAGNLSSGTMGNIGNYAASRGVALGQPNSAISNMIGMNVTGTSSEGQVESGLSNYLKFLSGVGSTQTDPSLAASISQSNATLAAAPDPATTATTLQAQYEKYMNQMMSPAGGSGSYSMTMPSNPYSQIQYPSSVTGSNAWGETSNPYSVYSFGGAGQNVDFSGLYD